MTHPLSHVQWLCGPKGYQHAARHIRQARIQRLARRCTRTRLYPNPASPDSKDALKVLLAKLITDMDYASKLHDMYSAALMMYSFPVQGVVDGIKVSGVHCVRIDCMEQNNVWMTSTRAELLISASGVLDRVEKMSITFKKVEIYLFREWEKSGTAGFQKVINALPGTEDLKEMTVMKKVFPRQVKEMSAVEHSSNTKTLLADRPVNVDQKDDGKYDSGCETFP